MSVTTGVAGRGRDKHPDCERISPEGHKAARNDGVSLSSYIAAGEKILIDDGHEVSLHAYGTNVESEWDAVMESIKGCHEAVHAMGAPRITTTIRLGTRIDRDQSMAEKVRSVEKLLEES